MADKILLSPIIAQTVSDSFVVKRGQPRTVYLYPVGDLTAGELASLQFKDPAGTWADCQDAAFFGGAVDLQSTMTSIVVEGEGVYRVDKLLSTNAVGVGISDQEQG
jgi:hypothetical protein